MDTFEKEQLKKERSFNDILFSKAYKKVPNDLEIRF